MGFFIDDPTPSEVGFFIKWELTMIPVKEKIRTVTFLTREQIDFLDKMGKDALFYKGLKLSRAEILSELVDLLKDLKIDIKNFDLEHANLEQGVLKYIHYPIQYQTKKKDEHKVGA